MSAGVRVAAFAALLAVVFAAAALAGQALDPGTDAHDEHAAAPGHAHAHAAAPAGLSAQQDGLLLVPATTQLAAGRTGRFAFTIADETGRTVRDFDREQARRMHLVVVSRDLADFQHLHPTQTPSGAWTTALRLPAAGSYRAYADFSTGGARRTLAVGLLAPGPATPRPLPAPSTTAHTDGYDVTLHAAAAGPVRFTVSRGGAPVAGLQPYLGARGHLVALRASDLAYEHVHPLAATGAPGEIAFSSAGSAPGSYRLFLQFRHGGRVHTAAFTRRITP
ncbi:MAG TPA: hypothetical protein VL120_10695 [Solirubrobacteraceae bacterium]|jgi:hypothetical protein|nr:hypothetical protein [Solirubrobacteraceae bacterium]